MKNRLWTITLIALMLPINASTAGAKLRYAGWLPFWELQKGALDIAINLEKLHEMSPFSYEVNANGTLRDSIGMNKGFMPGYLSAVRDSGTKIVPTIAWFDGDAIHALMTNTKKRQAHEDLIAKLVKDNHFDGIDIDYESKKAETINYFSTFLKGLAIRLHPKGKTLSCTIEARMPPSSRYEVIPDKIEYANDYAALNTYCDEVRIMAYDQGLIDIKLNAAKGSGNLYAPVADPDWVEKIIQLATKTISKKKIMLGVPTYGYEYQVSWSNNVTTYRRLRSVNYFTAFNRGESVNAPVPARNSAGELSFTYTTSTFFEVSPTLRWDVSSTLPSSMLSETANSTTSVTRFASFPDAESVAGKVQLAKKYGLRGVVLFKLDGSFDPLIWEVMK